ncbi:MAG: hypothetical protein K6F53_09570 [Lachnospiraceae bacterium]|nr:hypothetical protein [Lachnospiraceae bacterium]
MEKEIRRRQSILSITGIGVIFFGLWNFIKINLYFFLAPDKVLAGYDPDSGVSEKLVFVLSYVFCIFVALIGLFIRLWIGRAAIREARDLPFRSGYPKLGIFLLILQFAFLVIDFVGLNLKTETVFDFIASLIVDLTSFFMLWELVSSAIKLRKLKRALQAGA